MADPYEDEWQRVEALGTRRQDFTLEFFARGIASAEDWQRWGALLTYTPYGWEISSYSSPKREENVQVVFTIMCAVLPFGDFADISIRGLSSVDPD